MRAIIFLVSCLLISSSLYAATGDTTGFTPKTEEQKQSYSLGLNIGTQAFKNFEEQSLKIDPTAFAQGVEDALANRQPRLSEQEVISSLRGLQQRLMETHEKKIASNAKLHRSELFATNSLPMLGNKKAPITIVEFFDYRCPHCQRIADMVQSLTKSNKNIRIIMRDFPILGPDSVLAAKAALAAKAQNRYFEFHNALMQTRGINRKKLLGIAKDLKLNIGKFTHALDGKNNTLDKEIEKTHQLARNIGLPYTPGFFIAPTPTGKANTDDQAPLFFITGEPSQTQLQDLIRQAEHKG